MSHHLKILIAVLLLGTFARSETEEKVQDIIVTDAKSVSVGMDFDADTMPRLRTTTLRQYGKFIGAFVTTAGVVSHLAGFPLVYFGLKNHSGAQIYGGMSAVFLGIPLAGAGSSLTVVNAFEEPNANKINATNWKTYGQSQLIFFAGITCIFIGAIAASGSDSEYDEDEGADGPVLVALGSLATIWGLWQTEVSLFKFSNSVIDSYKTSKSVRLEGGMCFLKNRDGNLIPGFQALLKF